MHVDKILWYNIQTNHGYKLIVYQILLNVDAQHCCVNIISKNAHKIII